ncbi:MAG: hypothetical protein KC900_14145 [Candidatus Omnitrophica bacterium]|nr:hypothetical protein [Candidatus Omnitrophota bacterium]
MKNIHKISIYFVILIVLFITGGGLILGRIHVMTIAHERLIEEHHEIDQITAFLTRIDTLMGLLVQQQDRTEFSAPELSLIDKLAKDLEQIRGTSVRGEEFEESGHSLAESRRFVSLFERFQRFLTSVGQRPEGREELLDRLESLRQAGADLQAFYMREMGEAADHAQLIEVQVMHRIAVIGLVFLLLLCAAAVWFVYLINRSTLMLIEREKNLTIGLLAQSLSHEIRNPLSIIKSSTSVIRRKLPPDSEEYEITGYLRDEADRISNLVDQLLQLRAEERPQLAAENPAEIIGQVSQLVSGFAAKAGVAVSFKDEVGPQTVTCDRNQIKQVLINVIINAIEASDGTGVTIETQTSGRVYDILVSDRGMGMDPRTLREAYTPFFTTKENGSGLGLFVARKIMEGNGGGIAIKSAPGAGTTVTITLRKQPENSHGG